MLNHDKKRCIQCNNAVKTPHLLLADNTYLDQECLNAIYSTLANNTADEDMTLYYQYVISLVMTCKKCNHAIDGTARKKGANCSPGNFTCHLCQPLAKETETCDQCNRVIEGKNRSMKIEGVTFCSECLDNQIKGLCGGEKEKEEKPEFRGLQQKPQMKYLSRPARLFSPLKKQQRYEFKPLFGMGKHINEYPKKQLQKQHSQSSKEIKPLERLVPFLGLPNNLESGRKEKIRCAECGSKFELHMFRLREEGYNICKKCYKASHEIKKKEKEETPADYHLDLLFKEAMEETRPLEELFEMLPTVLVNDQDKVELTLQTKDSHQYDLKGCKICLNAESSMINTKCRHLMMCDNCFKQMQSRHKGRGDNLPCPVCSTVGRYQKYIEPIYI